MLHGAGIFTHIYPINDPNVDKYSIHGAYGIFDGRIETQLSAILSPGKFPYMFPS